MRLAGPNPARARRTFDEPFGSPGQALQDALAIGGPMLLGASGAVDAVPLVLTWRERPREALREVLERGSSGPDGS